MEWFLSIWASRDDEALPYVKESLRIYEQDAHALGLTADEAADDIRELLARLGVDRDRVRVETGGSGMLGVLLK